MKDAATWSKPLIKLDLYGCLGFIMGLVMPVISAILYPTYMHQMVPEWAEWTRLLEMPFIACELVIIHFAIRAGYSDRLILDNLPWDVIVALALLLVGLIASSAFVSKMPAISIMLSITTLIHLRFGGAVFSMARSAGVGGLDSFFAWLGLGLIVLTIMAVWKFSFPPLAWTVPGGVIEWPSALPGFISVRHFGSWTGAIASGLMIALLYGDSNQKTASIFYLLAAGLTCWSGTRAAVLAMGSVALIIPISLLRLPKIHSALRVFVLSTLSLFGGILFSPRLPEFTLFWRQNMDTANGLSTGRLRIWQLALSRWLDAPLFGWGSGSTFWELGWIINQPHNFIVQFLISWGAIGGAGAIWLLGRGVCAIHPVAMKDATLRPILSMLYSVLIMGLFEGMLYYPRFIMLIMVCFAFLFAAKERRFDSNIS